MALMSGQITVGTAGTAVQGPATPTGGRFALAAHPGNTGVVYVGNDGADDVTSANGYPLHATATIPGASVVVDFGRFGGRALSSLWFDAATSGDKICWLKLE